jgi:hypothetical protein
MAAMQYNETLARRIVAEVEKRLARTLLLLANFGKDGGKDRSWIPSP